MLAALSTARQRNLYQLSAGQGLKGNLPLETAAAPRSGILQLVGAFTAHSPGVLLHALSVPQEHQGGECMKHPER